MEVRLAELDARKTAAANAIDSLSSDLRALSLDIHGHPEVNFQEVYAHRVITEFLAAHGLKAGDEQYGLPTAFRASYGSGRPVIAILCEYDALPEIGHACGHNLIATAGVAAALGVRPALDGLNGTVVLLGTPAEEGGGGKAMMIEHGAFDGVEAAMMVHPAPGSTAWPAIIGVDPVEVEFFGRHAHAAMAPHEGVNALDAIIMTFNAISLMRQQMAPDTRVHGVITKGGAKPNIIPDHTAAEFYVRAPNAAIAKDLRAKVEACFQAAALATGCRVEYRWPGPGFMDMRTNGPLADAYTENAEALGIVLPQPGRGTMARTLLSTDMGNVSYVTPSIHPMFAIPTAAGNHTPEFARAARTPEAHAAMLDAAKLMAMTTLDLLTQPDLLAGARRAFDAELASDPD